MATWAKSIRQVLGDLRPHLGDDTDAVNTWAECATVAAYIHGGSEEIKTLSEDIRTWEICVIL